MATIYHRQARGNVPDCPQCMDETGESFKLGDNRGKCPLCNRFAQRVRREVLASLQEEYREEFQRLTSIVEETLADHYIADYRHRSLVSAGYRPKEDR